MSGAIGAKEEEFGGLNQRAKRTPFHETVRATSIDDGINSIDNIDPSVLSSSNDRHTKLKAVADPFGLRQSLDASPKDVRVRMLPHTILPRFLEALLFYDLYHALPGCDALECRRTPN